MKINPLLSEVIKGIWLLEPSYLIGFAPQVQKIIAGEHIEFNGTTASLVKLYDSSGNLIPGEYLTDWSGAIIKASFDIPKNSYAVVNMKGPVVKYGDLCTWGADEIVGSLRKVDSIKNIKGIILDTDGPGGAVSAIGPFLQFAKTKTKPIVGLADACMSLHYWAAVSVCDYLMADNDVSARFGSVGVVSSFQDAKPYWEEKGIKFHEIYPPESENKNEAFRLALEGKYDMIIEEHLSPIAQKFQAAVRAGRPNLKEEKGVLNGKTYDADKALGLGMIDGIGSMADALEMINRLELQSELKAII